MDVSDVNEYPPRFPADSVRASVAEEEAVGTEVKRRREMQTSLKFEEYYTQICFIRDAGFI